MSENKNPIIIIGAGGAGLIAAWRVASLGAPALLLERNPKPGIKLLISGGGKCNVTHTGSVDDVRSTFMLREARFLKHALYAFTNDDVLRLLAEKGVQTYERPNGRVFPVSSRASDVVNALLEHLRDARAELRLNARVEKVLALRHAVTGVSVNGSIIPARQVILATGGTSYKKTGTTGDGIAWAKNLGHTIVPLLPALAPIIIEPPLPADWRGVALRGGRLEVYARGKKIDAWADDILFTHEGISGPAALEVSRSAASALKGGDVVLRFDFFPDRDFTMLDEELTVLTGTEGGRHVGSLLEPWVPKRLVPYLLSSLSVAVGTKGHMLTREERRSIVRLLKSWEIGRVGFVDIDRGEVTAGGVSLDDVDPRTMRSRKVKGLFVAGEILDIAGRVGGYNLQAAFSTGYVAGGAAAAEWMESNTH